MLLDLTRENGLEVRTEAHPGVVVIHTISAENVADGVVRREGGEALVREEVSHLRGSPQTIWETRLSSRDNHGVHETLIISTVRGLGDVMSMQGMRVEVQISAHRPSDAEVLSWELGIAAVTGPAPATPMFMSWLEPIMPGASTWERVMGPDSEDLQFEDDSAG